MEITDKDRRRLLKDFSVEHARVDALRRQMMEDEIRNAERRAEFFVDHGFWPPSPPLPSYPIFPPECQGMICGGKGRRSGQPCRRTDLYANGRCKWHGGLSTGPKTAEGKTKSLGNLKRGPKL
jgi:hypothetical protein